MHYGAFLPQLDKLSFVDREQASLNGKIKNFLIIICSNTLPNIELPYFIETILYIFNKNL